MELGGRVLGPARTNFNDYVGTVAADDAEAVVDRPSLYELAQIDWDRYAILAIDLKVDGPVNAIVYAIDRIAHGISLHAAIAELGESLGEIPSSSSICPNQTSKSSSGTLSEGSRSGW